MLSAVSFVLVACASVEIPDFKAHITLPASHYGFWAKTVSAEEGFIPAQQWQHILDTTPHIILFGSDWKILRYSLLKNCLTNDCKQAVGVFDELFKTIDDALKKLPSGK